MIALKMTGEAAVAARLAGLPDRLNDRLATTMAQLGADLQGAVVDNLSGRLLARRSGRLADAQTVSIDASDEGVSATVGFDPETVPYGAIQEFGGTTRAHLIVAKEAKALAFSLGGRLLMAKRVNHPGSVIPAHSFLRSALAALAPAIAAALEDAVAAEAAR